MRYKFKGTRSVSRQGTPAVFFFCVICLFFCFCSLLANIIGFKFWHKFSCFGIGAKLINPKQIIPTGNYNIDPQRYEKRNRLCRYLISEHEDRRNVARYFARCVLTILLVGYLFFLSKYYYPDLRLVQPTITRKQDV